MKLLDAIKEGLAVNGIGSKAVGQRTEFFGGETFPQQIEDNYYNYYIQGYSRNELVYACINEIISSFSEAPCREVDEDDEEVSGSTFNRIIKKPNQFMDEYSFWETSLLYLFMGGNLFWEKVRSRSGRVVELWPLRPDRVKIVTHKTKFISHYLYQIAGRDWPLAHEDVIHIKFTDPHNEFFGMPPIRAASRQIAQDNEATDFSGSMLKNRAIPGVVVKTQEEMDEAKAERMRKKWKGKFGDDNRGNVAFLQLGMEVQTLGMNMKDLTFPDLRDISETRICMAFGVSPILIGARAGLRDATYSNYETARRSLWDENLSPLGRRITSKINADNDLGSPRTPSTTIKFITKDVMALRQVRKDERASFIEAFKAGITKRDESRKPFGLPPDEEHGDEYVNKPSTEQVDGNMTPEGSDTPHSPPRNPQVQERPEDRGDTDA